MTLGHFVGLHSTFADAARLSLVVSVSATLLCVLAGIPVAAWLARHGTRRLGLVVEWLILLPLVLPPTVVGWILIELLGRRGLGGPLERLGLPILFTRRGAVIAAAVVAFPLFVLPMRAALRSVNPLVREAARLDGAGRVARLLRIDIPLLRGAALAAVALAFARALGEFGATMMVAGCMPGRTETLPLSVWSAMASGRAGEALAPALILIAIAAILAALQRGLLRLDAPPPRD